MWITIAYMGSTRWTTRSSQQLGYCNADQGLLHAGVDCRAESPRTGGGALGLLVDNTGDCPEKDSCRLHILGSSDVP